MKGTIRQGTPLVWLALLLAVGIPAAAGGAQPEHDFDCHDEHVSAAQAHQQPPETTDDDHLSGKDPSLEPAGSGSQGRSDSDPDGMTNNGADKPGCAGGFDDDRDGNNGCGNDGDFEDDNNGWCGKKPAPETAAPPETPPAGAVAAAAPASVAPVAVAAGAPATAASPGVPVQILGSELVASGSGGSGESARQPAGTPEADNGAGDSGVEVLGVQLSRPDSLARTGLAAGMLALMGSGLFTGGRVLRRLSRRR